MSHPLVVHHRKAKFDVYVGRPSKWGNTFRIVGDITRAEIIARYETWLLKQPHLMTALPELRGKVLRAVIQNSGLVVDSPNEVFVSVISTRQFWWWDFSSTFASALLEALLTLSSKPAKVPVVHVGHTPSQAMWWCTTTSSGSCARLVALMQKEIFRA